MPGELDKMLEEMLKPCREDSFVARDAGEQIAQQAAGRRNDGVKALANIPRLVAALKYMLIMRSDYRKDKQLLSILKGERDAGRT